MSRRSDKKKKRAEATFVFRQNDHIGAIEASADTAFLHDCFIDTGILDVLIDFEDRRQLLVGRTGSGKTALLEYLSQRDSNLSILTIPAEGLALNHLSNSTALTFVRQLGVNLDIFFRMLWRHVFSIEILKSVYGITDEGRKRNFFQRVGDKLTKNPNHRRALAYIEKWGGEKFWLDTDKRIIELTDHLERELDTTLLDSKLGKLDPSWIGSASPEQRTEVAHRAQHVINQAQMQELSWVLDLIQDSLDTSGVSVVILIDRLDEKWVDEDIRYLLIRALIETVRDFLKVTRTKILVAIRRDLVDRVFERTRDNQFQEEKYRSLFVDIQWTREQLKELVDERVGKLVRRKYENISAKFSDLFPRKIGDQDCFDYIVDRTLLRPRDVIHFVNLCIEKAGEKPAVTKTMLLAAEGDYSKDRLKFLYDEWRVDYPDLRRFVKLLRTRQAVVSIFEFTDAELEAVAIELSGTEVSALGALAIDLAEKGSGADPLRIELALTLYRVGLIGLKPANYEKVQWAATGGRIHRDDVSQNSRMYVHPMAWRALGTLGVAAQP